MSTPHVLPSAIYDPLPRDADNRLITPRVIVLHSNANSSGTSSAARLWAYIRRAFPGNRGVTQPHIQVDLDGTITQGLPFNEYSVTQANANPFAIGIETADYGSRTLPATPWTPNQLDSLAQIVAHCHLAYGIPLRRPTAWNETGVGGHRDFAQWSIHTGKTCPGEARYRQIPLVLDKARVIVEALTQPKPVDLPYAPEFGLWGPLPAIPIGQRPSLALGYGYGPGFDSLWVKYVQGVLRKAGHLQVAVTGLYDQQTAEAVLEQQIISRPGMPTQDWGEVGPDDWPWIDRIANGA